MNPILNNLRRNATLSATVIIVGAAIYRDTVPARPFQPPTSMASIGEAGRTLVSRADRTLFVIVREGCRYCAASMPFYRRLIATRNAAAATSKLRLVAAVLDEPDQQSAEDYAKSHRLQFDQTVGLTPWQQRQLVVTGTPTLVLANRDGVIEKRWVGRIDESAQRLVLDELFPLRETTERQQTINAIWTAPIPSCRRFGCS
jgi:hypothetical protein